METRRTEKPSRHAHPVFQEKQIMRGSILSVHVIDARELRPVYGQLASSQVRLMMEGNRSNTNEAQLTNNPVWNEVLAFDIDHGKDNL